MESYTEKIENLLKTLFFNCVFIIRTTCSQEIRKAGKAERWTKSEKR